MLLYIENYENSTIQSIKYPILSGAPSECSFVARNEIDLNTFIRVLENPLNILFEGYVTKKARARSKDKTGIYEYTAICKSFYEYSQVDKTVSDYGEKEDYFSGNDAEYQKWLLRENFTSHVTWPPVGDDPIVFDDQDASDPCPENKISVEDIEENTLPSHVKIEVKKYREKRFPCISDFDYSIIPTAEMIKTNPKFSSYGRQFKIMTPATPTIPYTEKFLTNASVGGSKVFCKGKTGLKYPKSDNFSFSTSINQKKDSKTLTKKGVGGSPDVPGTETTKKNIAFADTPFFFGFELPRVTGIYGTGDNQSELFIRARYLEEIVTYSSPLAGCNAVERIPAINHVEIEVAYDTKDTTHYRDWTFGGAEGLLHPTDDLGGGVWLSDLSGTYIEEEGIEKGTELIASALSHYEVLRYTTNFVFAGNDMTYRSKISFEGKDILLDSIEWTFGMNPSDNRTKYNGVRLYYGYSQAVQEKKKWIKKQQDQRDEKRERNKTIDAKTPIGSVKETFFAKIAWNFDDNGNDTSEAELLTKNDDGTWTPRAQAVYISWYDSNIRFDTAGDDTIFEIEKIKSSVSRLTDEGVFVRDLYRVIRCVEDSGTKITYFYTLKQNSINNEVTGWCVDGDIDNFWTDIYENSINAESYIKTTFFNNIENVTRINKIKGYIPMDWDLTGEEDFQYLEKSGLMASKFVFVPFLPVLKDKTNKIWESLHTNGAVSIATYKRK